VNVLNDRIFDLTNKENESKKETKSVRSTKKLDSTDYSSPSKNLNPNRSIHLADFDTNTSAIVGKASTAHIEDESTSSKATTTPNNINRITAPETPSSSIRQRQCAQQ
jgi:hypothetical protein